MGKEYERFSWLDDKKWAPWKVTVGVSVFCIAAWFAITVGGYFFCDWLAHYIMDAINHIRP